MEETYLIYKNAYSTPNILTNAGEYFKENIKNKPGFLGNSVSLCFNFQLDENLKKFIFYATKHLLKNYWETFYLSEHEKLKIKSLFKKQISENLLKKNALLDIGLLLAEILLVDSIENWSDLFKYFENLLKDLKNYTDNFLSFLITIFEKSKEKIALWSKSLSKLTYILFTNSNSGFKIREKLIILYYLSVKSLNWSDKITYDIIIDCLSDSINEWCSIFTMLLSARGSDFLILQFFSIKTLSIIFRDISELAHTIAFKILPHFLKYFFYITSIYLEEEVFGIKKSKIVFFNESDYELEETFNFEKVLQGTIITVSDFLCSLCFFNGLNEEINTSLFPIIWNLSHLILLTKEDESLWLSEPNQYIYENEEENLFNVKISVLDALNSFIEKYDYLALEIILEIIINFIDQEDPKEKWILPKFKKITPIYKKFGIDFKRLYQKPEKMFVKHGLNYFWKRKEAGLLILGNFIKDLVGITYKNSTLKESDLILKIYETLETNNNKILKGRALWTLSSMRHLYQIDNNLFMDIYLKTANFLSSEMPLCIRLCASKTITILSYKIAINKLQKFIKDNLNNKIDDIFVKIVDLLNFTNENTYCLVLDNIVSLYDIDPQIIDRFSSQELFRIYFKIFHEQHNNLMISGLIEDIFKRILKNKKYQDLFFSFLMEYFFEVLNVFFDDIKNNDHFCNIITLINIAIKENIDISSVLNILPQINEISNTIKDSRVIVKITILLKNLIHSQKIKEDNILLEKSVKLLIEKLLNPLEDESNCTYVGNLLMVFCEKKIENRTPNLLKGLVQKLSKSSIPSTNQGILIYFAYLLISNFDDLIDFLIKLQISTKSGLKILFDHWLLHQPKFIGSLTKSITIKALILIFEKHHPYLEESYTIAFKPSHRKNSPEVKLPLKILSILIETLIFEKNSLNNKKNLLLDTDERTMKYLADTYNNERVETSLNGEEDDEEDSKGSLNVDLDMDFSEEEFDDNEVKNMNNGFKGIESGSQSYISGLLGFDDADNDEYDETTEDDLMFFNVKEIDVISYINLFLDRNIKNSVLKKYIFSLDKESQKFLKEFNI